MEHKHDPSVCDNEKKRLFQSKLQLINTTSSEIDRLRCIIFYLTNNKTDTSINQSQLDYNETKTSETTETNINISQSNRIIELEQLLNQKQAEIDKYKSLTTDLTTKQIKSTKQAEITIKSTKQIKSNINHDTNQYQDIEIISNEYEWDEINQHNSEDDLWLVYKDKVFDLTRFLKFHPGGVETILAITAKSQDVTKPLKMLNHPPIADTILLKHYIGNVKNSNMISNTHWKQMDSIWDTENQTMNPKRMVTDLMHDEEAVIKWSDVFSVKIDILDKQHENIANLINTLYRTYQLKDIVELLHRWDVHCKTEETLFDYYSFDKSLKDQHNMDHRRIYHKIKDMITALRIKYDNNMAQCVELVSWAKAASGIFKKHHFEYDSQYVKHLDSINTKLFE